MRAARNPDTHATSLATDKRISLVVPVGIKHVYMNRPSLTVVIVNAYRVKTTKQ